MIEIQDTVRGDEDGEVWGGAIPLPILLPIGLADLGERRKLPQRGPRVITIHQRYRQTDGQRIVAIPRYATIRAVNSDADHS